MSAGYGNRNGEGVVRPLAPDTKSKALRRLLRSPRVTRVAGANDGLSAVLAERNGFDAIWASGLGISAAHAVPDASILTMRELLDAATVMDAASSLPVIADCDTGFGEVNNVVRMVREYERAGIAAVCIEDKEFPKRNSFVEGHELVDMYEFAAKIEIATSSRDDPDFVVIARLESLIAGAGSEDAFRRACCYADAGADAVLVHSKQQAPDEVLEFAHAWHASGRTLPLVVVPTTYPAVTCADLEEAGISAVIYANQSLRAGVLAMDAALAAIARAGSTAPVEHDLCTVKEVFALIGMDEIDRNEERFAEAVQRARAAVEEEVGDAHHALS
jgi:phosphoenolpyruvate phosphomutase